MMAEIIDIIPQNTHNLVVADCDVRGYPLALQ